MVGGRLWRGGRPWRGPPGLGTMRCRRFIIPGQRPLPVGKDPCPALIGGFRLDAGEAVDEDAVAPERVAEFLGIGFAAVPGAT